MDENDAQSVADDAANGSGAAGVADCGAGENEGATTDLFPFLDVPDGTWLVVTALIFAFLVLRWSKAQDGAARLTILRDRDSNTDYEDMCRSLEAAAPVAERALAQSFVRASTTLIVLFVAITYGLYSFGVCRWDAWGGGMIVVATLLCALPRMNRLAFSWCAPILLVESTAIPVMRDYLAGLDVVRSGQHSSLTERMRDENKKLHR